MSAESSGFDYDALFKEIRKEGNIEFEEFKPDDENLPPHVRLIEVSLSVWARRFIQAFGLKALRTVIEKEIANYQNDPFWTDFEPELGFKRFPANKQENDEWIANRSRSR